MRPQGNERHHECDRWIKIVMQNVNTHGSREPGFTPRPFTPAVAGLPYDTQCSLSVIVVNRNTSELLLKCLDHIFSSSLSECFSVVVVDNGSTDDSVAKVRSLYPHVTVIEAGRNLGFARANNVALERSGRSEFILVVNTDALLEKDCASLLLDLMRAQPRAGIAGPQLLNVDGSRQTSYEAIPTLATETLNRSLLKRLFPRRFPGKNRSVNGPEPVEAVIGAVMIMRRQAVEQLGGFDEDYFFFLEETDLALRMQKAGWSVLHHPIARAVHLQGATAVLHGAGSRIEFYRSRYVFFRKHYGKLSTGVLKSVHTANLGLNVLALGATVLMTAGKSNKLLQKFKVRNELFKWHLQGCPAGPGLPRD